MLKVYNEISVPLKQNEILMAPERSEGVHSLRSFRMTTTQGGTPPLRLTRRVLSANNLWVLRPRLRSSSRVSIFHCHAERSGWEPSPLGEASQSDNTNTHIFTEILQG